MSNSQTPPRPCTSYNLFLQLEREYILQNLLGYEPTITNHDNVFHPTDKTYPANAPPLPSRYSNLILPYDWHIPGKTKRRKRLHRKSHGKIGFHELNERISKAWSVTEVEVKEYCEKLSDIEAAKYKKDKKEAKRVRSKAASSASKKIEKKSEIMSKNFDNPFPSFDWSYDLRSLSKEDSDISPFRLCRLVSHESGNAHQCNPRQSLTEVDMDDEEIIDIWKSTPIEDNCDDVIPFRSASSFCIEIVKPASDNTVRKSFIDAEYEKFKEIGQLLLKGRRMPSRLRRRSIVACQA
eukprot:CAMPEP_0201637414 /NCGR_PEP_ID=MMETSP0493-20130528/12025_1 /ASSEMBLY_ACC=CAM_ASM_000838 /TAXON_ID=420259 /ORGANISM="Thalassiosira gravida, Strain GMp14c1" /LENGTH=293 /DNA_ID=CAMNT_0048109925 /DNA_START=35 /DNA_END=916 /DNA_ORIENTATION=+